MLTIVKMPAIRVSNADRAMMRRIQSFIMGYRGDDLLHDIELTFPTASYRAFFLAYRRAADRYAALRALPVGGSV